MQASKARTQNTIIMRELTTNQNLTVRLKSKGAHRSIGPCSRLKACIQTAISIQPRKVGARLPVVLGEISTNKNFAVGLKCQGVYRAICPSARSKSGIYSAKGI